ncbi:MAG: CotH kinase family protein [Myxococcota bacterium]
MLVAVACSGTADMTADPGPVDPGDGGTDSDGGGEIDVDPQPTTDYIFDIAQFHHFELEVDPADWQHLRENARDEEYVPATLIFEDERYDYAAVRFKGSYDSLQSCFDGDVQICPKLSIKVSFNEYVKGRFAGLRKLVFNSAVRDPTFMHEVVGYWMFREMGIAAPRASHAQLTVNGEPQGVFVLVEQVDKEFVQDRWDRDQGNLYKEVWPAWDSEQPYIDALRTNREMPDVSDMLALQALIDETDDDSFAADVADILDLSQVARLLAVDQAIANVDGPSRFYCHDYPDWETCLNHNFYWYKENGGELHLIPWDLDRALFDVNRDLGRSMWEDDCQPVPVCEYFNIPGCDPATERSAVLPTQCDPLYGLLHRATWDDYLVALAELANGPLSEDQVTPYVTAQRDKIRTAVAADPYGPGLEAFESQNQWLDFELSNQREEIDLLLTEQSP